MKTMIDRVGEVYAGWNAGRLDAVMAHLTADVVWDGAGSPGVEADAFGRTETGAKLQLAAAAWAGWEAQVERRLQRDDVVLVIGALVREADGGRVPFRHLWDLREDGICRLREQLDTSAMLHVLAGVAA